MFTTLIKGLDLRRTADSGQCFRMNMTADGTCRMLSENKYVEIRELSPGTFLFSCDEAEFLGYWRRYFDLDSDYGPVLGAVSPQDLFLSEAVRFSSGMRLLRQDPWETLVSFIISQRKNIPAIKCCIERLCALFGESIPGTGLHAFPTPIALALAGANDLKICSLGYRAKYISATAQMVAGGEIDLESLGALGDRDLHDALCLFPGVGTKVANCVMLFGYHRMDAFPRDVWIDRIEKTEYGGRFPEENYPGGAGLLQQYMFFFGKSKEYPLWKSLLNME